jgi:hypothetical protein
MGGFEVLQFGQQSIKIAVGNFRLMIDVIQALVTPDFVRQRLHAFCNL